MMKFLVIFDLDGVLVNTEEIFSFNLHKLLNSLGYICSLEQTRSEFAGKSIFIILKELESLYNIKIENHNEMAQKLRNSNLLSMSKISPMPESLEVLSSIQSPYCIASSGRAEHIKKILTHCNLIEYFKENNYFSGEDLGKPKPHPDVYLMAKKSFNMELCIAIEDSVSGVKAAVAANIPVIGFCGGKHTTSNTSDKLLAAGAFITTNSLKSAINISKTKFSK